MRSNSPGALDNSIRLEKSDATTVIDESIRNEIVHGCQCGQSQREIARALHVSRNTVKHVVQELERARAGHACSVAAPVARKPRDSLLDCHEATIDELLVRYPNISVVKLLRHLRERGFAGGYTILRNRVNDLRRRMQQGTWQAPSSPGAQAIVQYRECEIDLAHAEGKRAFLFSYSLSYSLRRYLHFTSDRDLITTLHEHARAFRQLGGVAATAEYASVPFLIERFEAGRPVFNSAFLRFASHYAFRPRLARAPVEGEQAANELLHRIDADLLQATRYRSLDHANDALASWLVEAGGAFRRFDSGTAHALRAELGHLIPLPENAWRG